MREYVLASTPTHTSCAVGVGTLIQMSTILCLGVGFRV